MIRIIYRIGSVWHESRGWFRDDMASINRYLAHIHVQGARDVQVLSG